MSVAVDFELTAKRIHLWTRLGVDVLRPIEVRGRERISAAYSFRLKLRTEPLATVDLDALVGDAACIQFTLPNPNAMGLLAGNFPQTTRDFCGILSCVTYRGMDDEYAYYNAVLRPRFWRLSLNRAYRFFSQKTTKDIVDSVIANRLLVHWRLSSEYSTSAAGYREYCVQYGESDLTFIQRLLEEDGLFFYFEHQYQEQPADPQERVERMVITDHIATDDETKIANISYDPVRGGNRNSGRIRGWRRTARVVSQASQSLDRNFQRPDVFVNSICPQPESGKEAELKSATMTEYPSGVARRYDLIAPSGDEQTSQLDSLDSTSDRDARIKSQRLAIDRVICRGTGDVASFIPGMTFRLLHEHLPSTGQYYLTSVEHLVRLASSTRSGTDSPRLTYRNRFRCYPATLPYRPKRRTLKPKVTGFVTAKVVSDLATTDDQVCVDKFGRIKVVFPWQEQDVSPSCWIRVSQFWAGPRWGAFFWPRVGHEVLVAFEHGDPDRPMVVGSVYNSSNMPPLTLPSHKLSNGIHSCSHKGNPIHNTSCVVFHDRQNEEYLQLHSETYQCITSETKSFNQINGQEITVKGHHWIFGDIGSGGGGSDPSGDNDAVNNVFKEESDFSNVGELFLHFILGNNSGDVELNVGDSFSKTFGRNIESYWGANIWLGCDPLQLVEMLASKSPIGFGFMAPLLFGAAGQGTTLIGGSQDLQYGTSVDIHRGKALEKQSPGATRTTRNVQVGNFTPVDLPAELLCTVAAVVLLVFDFIMMLLTKIGIHENSHHWRGFVKASEIWTLNIMPRLQGLLEYAETCMARADDAVSSTEDASEAAINALLNAIRAATSTDSARADSIKNEQHWIMRAADDIRNAIIKLTDSIKALAGVST
jgi:type VI secretion system secreted protein VgrG